MNHSVAVGRGPMLTHSPQDYNHATDSEYQRLRDLAEQAYERKHKLSHESQVAYKSGQKAKAHELSEKSKQEVAKAEDYNLQAAEYVFRQNNADSASDEIDLHGLYVKEAQWILKKRIYATIQQGDPQIRVIVGKGLHSPHGIAKLKPAVEELCDEARLKNYIDPHNAGVLIIELKGSQVPQSWNAPDPGLSVSKPQQAHTMGYQPPQGPQYQQQQQPHMAPPQQQQQQQQGGDGNLLVQMLSLLCVCISKSL
ncbi:ZYRO0G08690p [Zygosaccharomyces rouxii]|uniref:ZYRO0G08690p n=1 Tax=Zygosaccharomyces rouxii (strain ATCC 2623 / CBS 732 / NBRC 1130 / NCYC 568 / NRRL Y-229) TaxID=559307 RepID=C5E005_ZYGRC|nr:uncharacterized protein ZYRO0G08690g [Zygosaccharomyces rouxii]KAH9202433.1 hypothetical protein LQ764DRAFT_25487 [Zygosaccharomyces rouxii]CAR29439.1 ZYRO0G08690p [Zygosaccharomyces rouxii]